MRTLLSVRRTSICRVGISKGRDASGGAVINYSRADPLQKDRVNVKDSPGCKKIQTVKGGKK